MNDPVNDPVSPTTNPDLAQQVAALQRQVLLLLVVLIVVTATLTGFLFYESHIRSVDLNLQRPRLMQLITQYQNNQAMIQKFEKQLVDFGATHPGYEPVLAKYGLVQGGLKPPTTPAP
jgi:hypothetical protein